MENQTTAVNFGTEQMSDLVKIDGNNKWQYHVII